MLKSFYFSENTPINLICSIMRAHTNPFKHHSVTSLTQTCDLIKHQQKKTING